MRKTEKDAETADLIEKNTASVDKPPGFRYDAVAEEKRRKEQWLREIR